MAPWNLTDLYLSIQRDINCSMLLVSPSPKLSELFFAVRHFSSKSHHLPLTLQHPIDRRCAFNTMVSYPLESYRPTIGLFAVT